VQEGVKREVHHCQFKVAEAGALVHHNDVRHIHHPHIHAELLNQVAERPVCDRRDGGDKRHAALESHGCQPPPSSLLHQLTCDVGG
jgi:hypothetical protein